MIDTLQIVTTANEDGSFCSWWQWSRDNSIGALKGGKITTRLDVKEQSDREILAELAAVHYLLETRKINAHNSNKNLLIKVSFGAIKNALAKSGIKKITQLKNGDGVVANKGKTDKSWVANWADFLATKYFETQIEVQKALTFSMPENSEEYVPNVLGQPIVPIQASIIGADVIITRHAMHRCIGRLLSPRSLHEEDDLSDEPDARWTKCWKWFEKAFSAGSNLKRADLVDREWNRIVRTFECEPVMLSWEDRAVLVIVLDRGQYKLVTVLRNDEYHVLLKKPPVQFGNKLVDWHKARSLQAKQRG